jgi:predicted metal-binding membrane protein
MQSRGRSVSRPDAVLAGVLFTLILLAWSSLWFSRHSPQGHLLLHGFTYQQMAAESPMRFALIFISAWTLMTISMMMPTSVPLLLLFHRMVRKRAYAAWLVAIVVLGYLAIWISGGALLQVLNWTLQAGTARIAWPAAAPAMMVLGAVMALEKNASWGRRLTAPLGVLLLTGAVGAFVMGIRA